MSFAHREEVRLAGVQSQLWDLEPDPPGVFLPAGAEGDALHALVRESALAYFSRSRIHWWKGPKDSGGSNGPTRYLRSSQVACVNHLEPARCNPEVALQLAHAVAPDAVDVRPLDGGYLAYEWIGRRNYLSEPRWSPTSRGQSVTSLDALMVIETAAETVEILVFEWKYTETGATVRRMGREAIYSPHLAESRCPVRVDFAQLYVDPFYQLMRQTLLAWRMVGAAEELSVDWRHVHVIPYGNAAHRKAVSSWPNALYETRRYRVVSPSELLQRVVVNDPLRPWRSWLQLRYGT